MKRHIAILVIALAALSVPVTAGFAPQAYAAGKKLASPKTAAGVEAVNRGDYKIAYELFRNQASKGDTEAQFELGMLFALGKGVKKNLITAYMWTEIAARQKEPYADFMRDEVAANMSPADIRDATQQANAWMRNNGYAILLPAAK